jgi:Cu-processing system permease protein
VNKLLIVAGKEFRDGLRNRWIIAITLIFAVLSLGLAYFGSAAAGSIGFASLQSTIISLASLAVILIPLIALMLAYHAFVGEYEQGTMLLLITYPLSRGQLLLGKFLGQGMILAVAAIIGFGLSAITLILFSDANASEVLQAFGWFIGSSILLGWVFIAMAYVISVMANEKSKAAGLALLLWFLLVLVFDLALLALLVATEGKLDSGFLSAALLFNPTDVFRLINYMALDVEQFTGVLQLAEISRPSLAGLLSVLCGWIIAPLSLAWLLFKRRAI